MREEYRTICDETFKIIYKEVLGILKAEVYKDDKFCFEMNGEYDTDTENEYIKCWYQLEDC